MAQLTLPIPSGELKLTVIVGHNRKALTALVATGKPAPSPVWATGVVDTGTNVTSVTPAVLQQLGLLSTGQAATQTASGMAPANLYEVSVSIPPPANVAGPMLTCRDPIVMELPSPIPDVDVLIGLDILLDCRFFLDGPARQFTLEF